MQNPLGCFAPSSLLKSQRGAGATVARQIPVIYTPQGVSMELLKARRSNRLSLTFFLHFPFIITARGDLECFWNLLCFLSACAACNLTTVE